MASVNKAIILGNLGQDPELRYTPSGAAVCTLNIATTDVRNDPNNGRQERTEWHRVVVWNKQAENAAKYLAKKVVAYISKVVFKLVLGKTKTVKRNTRLKS